MSKLLESVLTSVKPLLSLSDSVAAATLTPAAAQIASLLLQLALLIGLKVMNVCIIIQWNIR